MTRYALLVCGCEPILWDFGSAAQHHRLYCPWLEPDNCRAGMLGLRGAIAPDAGLMASAGTHPGHRLLRGQVGGEHVHPVDPVARDAETGPRADSRGSPVASSTLVDTA
jgi:hypothetical protein